MRSRLTKYLIDTAQFHYSVFFILPFLAVYEYGLFKGALGGQINGADAILRLFFVLISDILSPGLAMIIFGAIILGLFISLIFQIISRRAHIHFVYFFFMLAESALIAFIIGIFLSIGVGGGLPELFTFSPNVVVVQQLALIGASSAWSKIVASVGAGVFEEFLFRVIILRIAYRFFKRPIYKKFANDRPAIIKASMATSLIFVLLHISSVPSLFSLMPIFLGSLFFCFLYIKRGYGICAVTHISYDLYLMFGIIA